MTRDTDYDESGDATDRAEGTGLLGRLTDTRREVLKKTAATSAVAGLGIASTGSAAAHEDDGYSDDEDNGRKKDDEKKSKETSVEFVNQNTAGETVVVESVTLAEDGYVAIHDATLLEGEVLESVIGVSEYLEAGTYENLEVELFDVRGADLDDYELEDDDLLIAMPHKETGSNEKYQFVESGGKKDGPFVKAGNAVVDLAYVRVSSQAAVEFPNQKSDGTTVTVESTSLSEGGFVAIHDASLFAGEVLDSVIGVSEYLDAGDHEDVEVELFDVRGADFDDDELQKDQPLVAMPHLDTNDNERYDFVRSEGERDGPYIRRGNAVIDLGFVALDD